MNIFKYTREKKRKEKEEADTITIMSCFRLPRKINNMLNELAAKHKESKIFIVVVAIEQLYKKEM